MSPLYAGRGPTSTRHLQAVPDPPPATYADRFNKVLGWLHRANGAVAIQREAKHFRRGAEREGNHQQAQAFAEVYEAAGRAREFSRP